MAATLESVKSKNGSERRRARFMWIFLINISAVAIGHMILNVYTNGVIRTIERRFSLSSSKTGLLNSCNDIFQICLVIFTGYFGQKYNKPRIICVTIMFSAISGFLMASPHILFSDYDDSYAHRMNSDKNNLSHKNYGPVTNLNYEQELGSENFTLDYPGFLDISPKMEIRGKSQKQFQNHDIQYCSKDTTFTDDPNEENEKCKNVDQDRVHPAFYVFVVAQLIVGIGSSGAFSLTMAYIDENAPKHKASLYIGILMSLLSFAPVSGLLLATLCLKFPENLLSGSVVESTDPSFIGCWWLGYLVVGIFIVVCAVPLWWYPKQFEDGDASQVGMRNEDKHEEGFFQLFKGIPKAIVGLMTNKLYIVNLCQIICSAYTMYGVFINLVRYIEIHFNRTAAMGSIIAGVVTAVTGAVGSLCGGALVSRFKMKAVDGIRLVLFISLIFATGMLILMNLACPQVEMDMNFDEKIGMNTTINDCNKPCLCTTNRVDYRPICASNNISYFSPCMAGCTDSINDTFTNCKCLRRPEHNNASISDRFIEGTAKRGYCIPPCNLLIPFAVTLFIMSFVCAVARVPSAMINLRIVKDEERAFALGVNSFAINLIGFIPSPLIFGYLIDKSCILWQVTCKTVGACLMFDVARLRFSIFGSAFFMEVLFFTFNFILYLFLRKMALGSALLSRHKEELCQSEVKVIEDEDKNGKCTEDDLKAMEMNELNGF